MFKTNDRVKKAMSLNCQVCETQIQPGHHGPPKKYCSERCRSRARRAKAKKRARKLQLVAKDERPARKVKPDDFETAAARDALERSRSKGAASGDPCWCLMMQLGYYPDQNIHCLGRQTERRSLCFTTCVESGSAVSKGGLLSCDSGHALCPLPSRSPFS